MFLTCHHGRKNANISTFTIVKQKAKFISMVCYKPLSTFRQTPVQRHDMLVQLYNDIIIQRRLKVQRCIIVLLNKGDDTAAVSLS